MVKINIINATSEHLDELYRHLSVQSLLDIKAVNGEVTRYILTELKQCSSKNIAVLFNGKVAYVVFVMPTEEDEHSIFLVSTTIGYADSDSLNQSFKSLIKDLPDSNFYSIVYNGNHRFAKLLKENGFRFVRNLIHGAERRNFLLLGKKKDGASSK